MGTASETATVRYYTSVASDKDRLHEVDHVGPSASQPGANDTSALAAQVNAEVTQGDRGQVGRRPARQLDHNKLDGVGPAR